MIKSTLILFLSFWMFASESGSSDCTFTPPKYDDRWVAGTELLSPRYLNGESCADVQKRAFIDWINRRSPSDMKKLMKENARQQYPEAVETARIEYPDPVADPIKPVHLNKGPFIKEYPDPVADPKPVHLNKGPFIKEIEDNARYEPDYLHGAELVADTPSQRPDIYQRHDMDYGPPVPVRLPEGISSSGSSVRLPEGISSSGSSVRLPEGIEGIGGGGGYNPYNCPACQCAESGATQ